MTKDKRFTDFWVCETGEVGLDDYGVEKRFTSSEFEDFLNELNPAKQCAGEKGLFIKADVSYSDRWLYPSEVFRKEKNMNIALPNEREFMTGECIVTDKDDTAYSIDELVNLLNYFNRCTVSNKEFMELKEENEQLKKQIKYIQGTMAIINGYLQDEGVLTLEKYREIQDYQYNQWKSDVE